MCMCLLFILKISSTMVVLCSISSLTAHVICSGSSKHDHFTSMCHYMMLCFLIVLNFCYANSEWVEISPILNSKNMSGAFKSSTSNYENILITPFLKDENIFTTPIYDIGQSNSKPNMRPSVNEKTKQIMRHRHGVHENIKRPLHSTAFEEDGDDITDNGENYEGFFSFLKMVQNKLMSHKTNSQRSKLSVLKHIRNDLLVNIHQRISKLWMPTISNKAARGYKDEEEEYHMEFPSNEGALMTIGFLTFAVFLIKLVIKLVQALKYKYEYYGTTTTTTTAASIIFLNRKKRDEFMDDSAKIMQYIDEYPNTLHGHIYS